MSEVKLEYVVNYKGFSLSLGKHFKTSLLDEDDMFEIFIKLHLDLVSKALLEFLRKTKDDIPEDFSEILGLFSVILKNGEDSLLLEPLIKVTLKTLIDIGALLVAKMEGKDHFLLYSDPNADAYVGRESTMKYLGIEDLPLAS